MDLEYKVGNDSFNARVSAIIYNKDKTKILLFKIDERDFYLLPGGKIKFNEDSLSAIKREIKEETGFDLEYKLYRIEENFLERDNENIMQYCFCYKAIYEQEINEKEFKCLDREGQKFYWIDINNLDNIKVFPKINFEYINSNDINYAVNKDVDV